MRDDIANLVYPVLVHGIQLRQRLAGGAEIDLATEQASLKGLLRSDNEARRIVDFGSDVDMASMASMGGGGGGGRKSADAFYGVRYALVCWLDEIFTVDSPWTDQWIERKLETSLYGTNDRAWKFWEQAKHSDNRTGSDALEVYYLCVMLGFRGEFRHQTDKLQSWVKATQARIAKGQKQEFPVPADRGAPTNVPPLRGPERLQKMMLTLAGFVLILIPFLAFYVVGQLMGP